MINTQELDTGITGAKRQSWSRANPRDVLKRLLEKDPEASEEEIEIECWEIIHHDQQQVRTIFEYWFANNYHRLVRPRQGGGRKQRVAQDAVILNRIREELAVKVEEKIQERVNIVLLDMILPSGKALRHSTREELLDTGGWAGRVAEHLLPQQTVEEAGMTEQRLRELYPG